ncbi:MAG: DNA-binding protein [Oxalobacteraceae bacterium]|nr:MAG: DNA-binding protein [Oxalobacteraceae bacterium]
MAQKYPGRTSLTTAEAALVLGRQKGTLLVWASKQNGPIRPVKSGRKNLWPIAELQKIAA